MTKAFGNFFSAKFPFISKKTANVCVVYSGGKLQGRSPNCFTLFSCSLNAPIGFRGKNSPSSPLDNMLFAL